MRVVNFRTFGVPHLIVLLLFCLEQAKAQDIPVGYVPRISYDVPLTTSGSIKDGDVVLSTKFRNKLQVGNDKKLAYRVTNKSVIGVSPRTNEATLKLVSKYIITSIQVSAIKPGILTVWDNERSNTPIVFHFNAGETGVITTNWCNLSRWIKFSWALDSGNSSSDRGFILHSITIARAHDFVRPQNTPIPFNPTATATVMPPVVKPTIIAPTLTPTTAPTLTPTKSPTPQATAVPTRFETPTPHPTATYSCPGFEIKGFGAGTTGGCGGTVYTVTSLADPITPTEGTFRYYVQNVTGPRIIKFAVAGTIVLRKDVQLLDGNVTIDASDAPAGGVQFSNGTLIVGASNVILRHLRYLVGPYGPNPNSADNIRIAGDRGFWVERIVIDHCSMQWATDENISIVDMVRNVTVQWSIIAEGLYLSTHNKADPHSMGALFHHEATNMTFHHNLFAHNNYRNPQLASNGVLEWTNNVVYNTGSAAGLLDTQNVGDENWVDAVGNYNKLGPNSDWAGSRYRYSWRSGVVLGTSHIYVKGNLDWNRTAHTQDEKVVVSPDIWKLISATRFVANPIAATSAEQAFEDVLNGAGATLPCRSSVDRRILQETRNGTGSFLNFPEEHGGWPDLTQGCN